MTRAGWLGVQLATASEPPARQRRIWGVAFWRRHQPPLSCDLLLNHARGRAAFAPMRIVSGPSSRVTSWKFLNRLRWMDSITVRNSRGVNGRYTGSRPYSGHHRGQHGSSSRQDQTTSPGQARRPRAVTRAPALWTTAYPWRTIGIGLAQRGKVPRGLKPRGFPDDPSPRFRGGIQARVSSSGVLTCRLCRVSRRGCVVSILRSPRLVSWGSSPGVPDPWYWLTFYAGSLPVPATAYVRRLDRTGNGPVIKDRLFLSTFVGAASSTALERAWHPPRFIGETGVGTRTFTTVAQVSN